MTFFPKAPLTGNESERLKALEAYDIIGSGQEKSFDELAELASYICDTPIGLITFIEEERQYDKSFVGIEGGSRARADSFCQYTILQDDILEVENLSESEVFKHNAYVTEDPNIRFYAGMPLSTPEGHNIGTLCVLDTKPSQLSSEQRDALRIVAKQVMTQLEIRKLNSNLKKEVERLIEDKIRETRKKLANKEAEANFLQKSIDKANATVTFDLAGTILSANKLFCDLMEYHPRELIGKNHSLLIPSSIGEEELRKHWEKLRKGIYQKGKFPRSTKTGKEKWLEANYNPIFDENGKVISVLKIAHDITSQIHYQKEVEEAKVLAEKALVAKDNFLSNMSHEIRTPLNAIIGFSEILRKERLNDTQIDHVNTILNAGENLLSIINDILDLSKIESGKFSLESSPFSPSEVLKSVDKMLSEKATEKGIELDSKIDENVPSLLLGDEFRLSQIVINLVNNAIKFTHEGFVKIIASAVLLDDDNCTLIIKVQDSGIGIPRGKQEMIFERFTQADTDTTRKFGGTGLGLNIVKLLVENFKGSLTLESEVGKGSSFSVSIPFKIEKGKEKTSEEASPKNELISGNILMFEDNLLNQKLGEKILTDLGHKLTIVSTGTEGVEWLKKNEADLILMDLQMPEMDGYQATAYIRNELKLDIPIIAMTAHSLGQEKAKCLEYGMNDYLSKPFKLEDLTNKIQTALTGSKPLHTLTPRLEEKDRLYDLKELELLASGNKDFISEMVNIFINEIPSELVKIQDAVREKNYETVFQTAHKLKSSYNLIGYKNVFLLKQMEEMGKHAESSEEIEVVFKRLKSDTEYILIDLKENFE